MTREEVRKTVVGKAGRLHQHLHGPSTPIEGVMAELRAITQLQGAAITETYNTRHSPDNLVNDLNSELRKVMSAGSTDDANVAAALAYLQGKHKEGALQEMKAAVNYSNDEGRVERVQRMLTPTELEELNAEHPDEMEDIVGDLGGNEETAARALNDIKGAKRNEKGEITETEDERKDREAENIRLLGTANAYGLQQEIDRSREKRGEAGGDATSELVSTKYQSIGNDVLSGGDPMGAAFEDKEASDERRKALWAATGKAFTEVVKTLPDGTPNVAKPGEKEGLSSIARYAAASRKYTEYVPDQSGRGYHTKVVSEGLDPNQTELIDAIVKEGPDSEDAAAATIMVELNRKSGKPKEDKLRQALGSSMLDAREGESDKERDKRLKDEWRDGKLVRKGAETLARERREKILLKVGQLDATAKANALPEGEGAKGERPKPKGAEEVRTQILNTLDTQLASDPTAKAYTRSMLEGRPDDPDGLNPDPVAAFDFALAHESKNKETLLATVGRMNRTQIDKAVKAWDDKYPQGPPLYERLGMFEQGKGVLEGDARNEVEIKFMGVPRNDRERAEVANMATKQQTRDSGAAGRTLASEEYKRMLDNQTQLLKLMGVRREDIDARGRIKADVNGQPIKGHFNEEGQLEIQGKDREEFETLMQLSSLHAESYKQAVDKIAMGITMALMVVAAVVTTFLTAGGAAAIWGPILITAGAGLVGIGMTAAIRGDRYTTAELQRDLVMTFVQAATAGLGAYAGTALKGAGTAAKAAATAPKVVGAMQKPALSLGARALNLGKEVLIDSAVGGTTNAINSAAGAAMDPENRRQGKSAEKAFEGGFKGFISGAAGAALTKPMGDAAKKFRGGALGERMAGNVASGFTTRLTEARVGQAMGDPHQSWAESLEAAKEGVVQDIIQSAGEHGAHKRGERRAARKAAARLAAAAQSPDAPRPRPEDVAAAAPAAARPDLPVAAPRPSAPPEQRPPPPGPRHTPESMARAAAVHEALPSDVRPAVEAAIPARPPAPDPASTADVVPSRPPEAPAAPPKPAAAAEVPAPKRSADEPRRPGGGKAIAKKPRKRFLPHSADAPDGDGPAPGRRPGADDEEPATLRRPPREADEDEPTLVRRRPEEPGAEEPRRPPPDPDDPHPDIKWAPEDFLEGAVMIDANSTSRAEIDIAYHNTIAADPTREVAVYRNPVTGDYILVFGDKGAIFIGKNREVGEEPRPAEPAGLGQDWKEILPHDIGRWELEAHYHPGRGDPHAEAAMSTRVPSTGEEGIGDFPVLEHESELAGGQPRESVIHFSHKGKLGHTVFGFDPASTTAKYWVDVENPATGKRERHEFAELSKYEAWAATHGARPHRAARPGDPDVELFHGTEAVHAESIKASGIDPHRRSGVADDFGQGFYMTLDPANAQEYASRRSRAEGGGAVIKGTIKLSDLGVVVDVRTGGEHRADWDNFLDRSPPAYPPNAGAFFKSTREYLQGKFNTAGERMTMPVQERGGAFEAFLGEKGLGHADAIRGDLGKDALTGGIAAKGGGEQIAIRSKRLAALINERAGFGPRPADAPAPPPKRYLPHSAEPDAGGPPPPHAADEKAAAAAARREELKRIDDVGIAKFRESRPQEAAQLDALLQLEPDIVRRAIAGDLPDAQRAGLPAFAAEQRKARDEKREVPDVRDLHFDELRAARIAAGDPPGLADQHVATLRALLRTPDERIDDYRDKVLSGEIEPTEVTEWEKRQVGKKGLKVLTQAQADQARLAEMEKAVLRFAKEQAQAGGGVRDFIAAAREQAALKAAVTGLDAEAAAALASHIDLEAIEGFRGLGPTVDKVPQPQRAAFKLLDQADSELLTEIVRRGSADPRENARLVREWRKARAAVVPPEQLKAESKALWELLKHPELRDRIAEARKKQADLQAETKKSVEQMVLENPMLLSLAHTNRELFLARYVSIMTKRKKNEGKMTTEQYVKKVLAYMSSHGKPAVGEATNVFGVGKDIEGLPGFTMFKTGSLTERRTNKPGIDAIAVDPKTPPGAPPGHVRVLLFDDKAVATKKLGDVSALTENLAANLGKASAGHEAEFQARQKQIEELTAEFGPDDPMVKEMKTALAAHEAAVKQMEAAAAAIAKIDANLGKDSIDPESGEYRYQSVEYAKKVAEILEAHGIQLYITSEGGRVVELAKWLGHYGFKLWDKSAAGPRPPPETEP